MRIALLGATGSIGRQTLDVVRQCLPDAQVVAMTAHTRGEELAALAREFNCENTYVGADADGLCEAATAHGADILVNALVGCAGLAPTMAAIEGGIDIALANKETLVTAGELVMARAREKNVKILPIDSEHSAIWQCLNGEKVADVEKIILTASGGPFRTWPRDEIVKATAADALKHPNWTMGAKITIDSATMMNKGLELIEAMHLFNMPPEKIEILVHPQSIIHSMVQFADGSVIAQLGQPDMRLPILYALTKSRVATPYPRADFTAFALTFEQADLEKFPCLTLATRAAQEGGTLPAVMNYINERAVHEFLRGGISFYDISEIIGRAFAEYTVKPLVSLRDITNAEAWAENFFERTLKCI